MSKVELTDVILRDAHQSLIATRMRTEVLPTTVFLELSVGHIESAVAVSLVMVVAAVVVLSIARVYGFGSVYEKVVRR